MKLIAIKDYLKYVSKCGIRTTPTPPPQSPVVHRTAQTPLVLFRIVYFYCFQVSRSIES